MDDDTLIPDAMVEAAARALVAAHGEPDDWDHPPVYGPGAKREDYRDSYRRDARAVLAAVWPALTASHTAPVGYVAGGPAVGDRVSNDLYLTAAQTFHTALYAYQHPDLIVGIETLAAGLANDPFFRVTVDHVVLRATVDTLRTVAGWGETTPGDLREVARQVEAGGADRDAHACCPVCEELECDAGCPLETTRTGLSATVVIDPATTAGTDPVARR